MIVQPMNASQLASELVRRRWARGQSTTNLDLQKLAYFCHGWHLALLGTPLVNEEFEAWRFGPVLPSIYHKFKVFASNPIPPGHPSVQTETPLFPGASTSQLIDRVLDVYSNASSFQLVDMSHAPDGPWAKAWNSQTWASTIDDGAIRNYFAAQVAHGG